MAPSAIPDFGRSFVSFTSTRVDHTPRLQLAAVCRVQPADGPSWSAYLSHPCIAESMYLDADLIQEPPTQVYFVIVPGIEALMIKSDLTSGATVRTVTRLGDDMPTKSGQPSRFVALEVTPRSWADADSLSDHASIRSAALEGRPMVGRTRYAVTSTELMLEYPVTTVNIGHGREAWQVDAGPLVTLDPEQPPDGVGALTLGYLVFNGFDRADLLGWAQAGPLPYRVGSVDVETELFATG